MSYQTIFELFRGDDFTLQITFTDAAQAPIDITGWSFKSTIKLTTEDSDDDAPVKVDIAPVTGVDATNGVLNIFYPKEQTQNLIPTEHFVDLQRETNNYFSTVFVGKVTVKPDVTRRVS